MTYTIHRDDGSESFALDCGLLPNGRAFVRQRTSGDLTEFSFGEREHTVAYAFEQADAYDLSDVESYLERYVSSSASRQLARTMKGLSGWIEGEAEVLDAIDLASQLLVDVLAHGVEQEVEGYRTDALGMGGAGRETSCLRIGP